MRNFEQIIKLGTTRGGFYFVFVIVMYVDGVCGGVVIKALFYKPAGRGFDYRWCLWNFH
jgi:hypothetical protein